MKILVEQRLQMNTHDKDDSLYKNSLGKLSNEQMTAVFNNQKQ